jgi:hypothetical protein
LCQRGVEDVTSLSCKVILTLMLSSIEPLHNLSERSTQTFGGKASRLGVLRAAGFSVPDGVALSFQLLRRMLRMGGISTSPEDLLVWNQEIASQIRELALPKEIDISLAQVARTGRWAVRSSAICEDDSIYSFAGVFDSIVDIGVTDISAAVTACWSSLYSDAALAYCLKNRISLARLEMAVVIQRFVRGEISGVTFTADPVSGKHGRTIVNVVSGPCGGFVSGTVPSSRYVVDRVSGTVVDRTVTNGAPEPDEETICRLAHEAHRVEALFGHPQDIEWTLSAGGAGLRAGELTLLQSRPITRLAPERFDIDWRRQDQRNHTWWGLPGALQPFYVELLDEMEKAANPGAKRAGLPWFYTESIQVGPFRYERTKEIPDDQRVREEYHAEVQRVAERGDNIFTDVYLPKILMVRERLDRYESRLESLTDDELVCYIAESFDGAGEVMGYHWLIVQGCLERQDLERLSGAYGLTGGEVIDLVYGESMLARERRMLLEMAQHVCDSTWLADLFARDVDEIVHARLSLHAAGKELLEMIDEYLATYGLCAIEWNDRRVAKETPWTVVGRIRAYLQRDVAEYLRRLADTLSRQSEIENRLCADPATSEATRREIIAARKSFLVRDDHSYYIDATAAGHYRSAAVEAGRRLADRGVLADRDDLDFLKRAEVTAALEGRLPEAARIAAQRREKWLRQIKIVPPRYIGKPPKEQPERTAGPGDEESAGEESRPESFTLRGVSGANLNVCGIAATSLGPPGSEIPPDTWRERPPGPGDTGTVLISSDVRSINPSSSIPPRVTGLIFDGWGSPFDHIGIVARELGIAAVFGVDGALGRIHDGDIVEIRGATGEVHVTPHSRG